MNNLKTLKDMEGFSKGFSKNMVDTEELRAEVIKWVKGISAQNHGEVCNMWALHFFNLTPEDIK